MTRIGRTIHLAIVGPTATGKSDLALAVAEAVGDAELVSVDSMQVYLGMDLGTAKPAASDRSRATHHLVDLLDPAEECTASWFQERARDVIVEIEQRGARAILVGGTGLYHRAVIDALEIPGRYPDVRATLEAEEDTFSLHERLRALDPIAAGRMEPGNRRRILRALEVTLGSGRRFSSFGPGLESYPPVPFQQIGLMLPREEIDRRIERRFLDQLESGLLDEVRSLSGRPGGLSRTARQALGYRQLLDHVEMGVPLDEAVSDAIRAMRSFARRQERWFRRDPRVRWIDAARPLPDLMAEVIEQWAGPGRHSDER